MRYNRYVWYLRRGVRVACPMDDYQMIVTFWLGGPW